MSFDDPAEMLISKFMMFIGNISFKSYEENLNSMTDIILDDPGSKSV